VHKEELAALTAKDPEVCTIREGYTPSIVQPALIVQPSRMVYPSLSQVEQILLDAYVHRAMLAWFQAGAAEASRCVHFLPPPRGHP
jgi:hypothetical protein